MRDHLDAKMIQYYADAFKAIPPVDEEEKQLLASFNAALTSGQGTLYGIYKNNTKAFNSMSEKRKAYFEANPPKQDNSRADAVKDLIKSDISFTRDIIEAQDRAGMINAELKPKTKMNLLN
ncbi:hypothetical protein [Mucilaginibacter antarcticus]|uniref:hypothetical protein n=1 Tax=Mucilaginibacter antarcticus TaxID=1855725 RepID=UPI00362A8DF7